jgi:hypothetical protein
MEPIIAAGPNLLGWNKTAAEEHAREWAAETKVVPLRWRARARHLRVRGLDLARGAQRLPRAEDHDDPPLVAVTAHPVLSAPGSPSVVSAAPGSGSAVITLQGLKANLEEQQAAASEATSETRTSRAGRRNDAVVVIAVGA